MFSHTIFGGEKNNWVVAFYGYGQSADVYKDFFEQIKDSHNLLIVDNPMQNYSEPIQLIDFKDYLNEVFSKNKIVTFQSVSYSMGSRLNLYLPLLFAEKLEKIILIAPDGITYNFWNRVAISTPWGGSIFNFFVENGNVYLNTLLFFHKIGIVNKSLYAFSKWNMRDEQRRKNVFNAWMNMRFFRPKLKEVNTSLEKNNIKLISYFGKNDPVIPLSVQRKCARNFPKGEHEILDTDHSILGKEIFSIIAKEIRE